MHHDILLITKLDLNILVKYFAGWNSKWSSQTTTRVARYSRNVQKSLQRSGSC